MAILLEMRSRGEGEAMTTLDVEEDRRQKIKIWLVWTQDPITYTSSLRSVCTDKGLADYHALALKDGIRRAREGEHSSENEQSIVVVEESDANHLYGERTLRTIRDLEKQEQERSI